MGEPILDPGRQAGMCLHDGAVWRKAKGDTEGHAQVDVLSSALPSGAATETTLSSLLTELQQKLETADLLIEATKQLAAAGYVFDGTTWQKVKGDTDGHAQVDILSSALPSGAATETTLSAINTELAEKLETADLALDADSHLDTHKIPHASAIKIHWLWNVSIPAGATETVLPETAGCGQVRFWSLLVDGLSGAAADTVISFTVDGETSPSTQCTPRWLYAFMCQRRTVDLAQGGVSKWDTVNYIYGVWCTLGPSFESSLNIKVTNGDSANAITVLCGIWVEWLK